MKVLSIGVRIFLALMCAGTLSSIAAVTVTINSDKQYQTIDGFGGCAEFNNAADYSFNSIGTSLMRLHLGAGHTVEEDARNMRILQSKNTYDEKIKFILSTWSPPNQFKDFSDPKTIPNQCWWRQAPCNGTCCGGRCAPSSYGAYADYLVKYLEDIEQQSGEKVYAVNFSNEPSFPNPFASCVWSPTEWVAFLKVFQPKLKAKLPHINTMGPEDVVETMGYIVERAIGQDPTAKQALDIYGVHHYPQDIDGSPTCAEANRWKGINNVANVMLGGKKIIMTETSDPQGVDSWDVGFKYAYGIHMSLFYGKNSGWTHYGSKDITDNPNYRKAYKAYGKYVRPGAIMLDLTSGSQNVLATAFYHPVRKSLTVVLLNISKAPVTINLSGNGVPSSFECNRSSPSEEDISVGTVNASSITLPGPSITNLVAKNFSISTVAVTPERKTVNRTAPTTSAAQGVQSFRLDGTRVAANINYAGAVTIVRNKNGTTGLHCNLLAK